MPVLVRFECSGCDAKAEGTERLHMEFVSLSGKSHGFGRAVPANSPADVAPPGWVAFDPYTFCTYCPTCWASILEPSDVPT